LSLSSQKYGFGIRDLEKTYSGSRIGVKKAPDPGSGSAALPHCLFKKLMVIPPIYLIVINTIKWGTVKRGKIGHLITFKSKLKIVTSIVFGFLRWKSLYELCDLC
jgi:hypothetical protein